ncbi:MAG TPA: hypothetical protein VL687_07600 [Methylomirabilota bacterium]|nr:hypothetical protein [Methylomirabilota bacterium]
MTNQPMSPRISPPTEPVPGWAPVVPAPVEGRSGSVFAAGVILLVIATLVGLFAILAMLGAAVMGQFSNFSGSQSGLTQEQIDALSSWGRTFILVIGGVALAISAAHLISGIGVLRRRSWGRILGLVMSVLGVLLWALVLVSTVAASGQPIPAGYLDSSGLTAEEYRAIARTGWIVGVSLSGIALAAYLFVTVVLIRKGREFA